MEISITHLDHLTNEHLAQAQDDNKPLSGSKFASRAASLSGSIHLPSTGPKSDPAVKSQAMYHLDSSDDENTGTTETRKTTTSEHARKPPTQIPAPAEVTREGAEKPESNAPSQPPGEKLSGRENEDTQKKANMSLVLWNSNKRTRGKKGTTSVSNWSDHWQVKFASVPAFNPLFTWLRTKNASTYEGDLISRNVSRILAKTHKSLLSKRAGDDISIIYRKTCEFTADEFIHRHPNLARRTQRPDDHATQDRPAEASPSKADDKCLDPTNVPSPMKSRRRIKKVSFKRSSGSRSVTTDKPMSPIFAGSAGSPSLVTGSAIVQSSLTFGFLAQRFSPNRNADIPPTIQDHIRDMEAQIENLCLASIKFVNLFIPRDTFDSETVIQKIWGSVEKITRQAELSFTIVCPGLTEAWSIRSFSFPGHLGAASSTKGSWAGCERCKTVDRESTLLEALRHIHAHMGQDEHDSAYEPHEDPCVVWLQAHHAFRYDNWGHLIRPRVRSFITIINRLQEKASEIGTRCAKPTGHGKAGSDLPKNLVFAFEAIVALYCIAADDIACVNRNLANAAPEPRSPNATAPRFEEPVVWPKNFTDYVARANFLLDEAQKDAILFDITDKKSERVDLEPVGREFLLGVILSNLHELPLEGSDSVDIIAPYKKHASRLQYLVHNRPKKRLFIELTALERELEALRKLVDCQIEILQKVAKVTDPHGTRETKERLVQYELECEFMEGLQNKLYHTEVQIDQLQRKVAHLKIQVVQVLEVLEEGHGKAIRVFTLVTLFFLPMSFVTSFLGMNTSDIRNTGNDSRFFWLIALPFTAGVVGVAFLYGYKWDDITESMSRMQARRRAAREASRALDTLPDGLPTYIKRPPLTNLQVGRTFREFRGVVRRRASAAVKRKNLEDSDDVDI
ncbi:hypothetical protein F4677DRAFT_81099 [Hypoxylon crocopeplum]|nr:hypothetical protein F4677DRAFT_81099 [Hypoxylon crocopeplum]